MTDYVLHPLQDTLFRVAAARSWFPLDCTAVVYRWEEDQAFVDFWRQAPEDAYEEEISYIFAEYSGLGYEWPGDVGGVQRAGWPDALTRSSTVFLKYGEQDRLDPIVPRADAVALVERGRVLTWRDDLDESLLSPRDHVRLALVHALLGLIPPNVSSIVLEWTKPALTLRCRFLDEPGPGPDAVLAAMLDAASRAVPGVLVVAGPALTSREYAQHDLTPFYGGPTGGWESRNWEFRPLSR